MRCFGISVFQIIFGLYFLGPFTNPTILVPFVTKMPDMCIISEPPALAAAFGCAVTVLTKPERLVARNGDLSIFSAYRRIFPQARFEHEAFPNGLNQDSDCFAESLHPWLIYDQCNSQACQQGSRKHPVKGKIACLEFNKVLQAKYGFECSRSRKKSIAM